MPVTTVGRHQLAWSEAGAGKPALLLHCSLAHSGAFARMMMLLADRLAMRAPDLPGHGATGIEPGGDPQDQALADAVHLLEGHAPAHVLGHSFGATVALRLAVERPDLVATLTLIEPVQFSLLADENPDAHAIEVAAGVPLTAALEAGDNVAALNQFLGRWGGGVAGLADPAQVELMAAMMPHIHAGIDRLLMPKGARVHTADLDRLAMPVLLAEGAESPAVARQILDVIASHVPHARRLVVEGAGHMAPLTHPSVIADAFAGLAAATPQPR